MFDLFKKKKKEPDETDAVVEYFELIQACVEVVLGDRQHAAFPVTADYKISYFVFFAYVLCHSGVITVLQRRLILQVFTLGVIKQTGEDPSAIIERRIGQLEKIGESGKNYRNYVEIVEMEQNKTALMSIWHMRQKCIDITCQSIADVLKTISKNITEN